MIKESVKNQNLNDFEQIVQSRQAFIEKIVGESKVEKELPKKLIEKGFIQDEYFMYRNNSWCSITIYSSFVCVYNTRRGIDLEQWQKQIAYSDYNYDVEQILCEINEWISA